MYSIGTLEISYKNGGIKIPHIKLFDLALKLLGLELNRIYMKGWVRIPHGYDMDKGHIYGDLK